MKVIDFIKKYQLDDFVRLFKEEINEDIPSFMFFITDDNGQVKEEYKNFYSMLKTLEPDKNIKGEITVDPLLGDITVKNSRNERIEFLSWEEVLALDVNTEDLAEHNLLHFIDELLFRMTMHGKAFDRETKHRIEYEEKIKQSLIPEPDTFKEKVLYFLRDVLSVFDSSAFPVLLSLGIVTAIMSVSNLPVPVRFLSIITVFITFLLLNFAYIKLDDDLEENFRLKLKKNIEERIKEHPEDSLFLNLEYFESFDCFLRL